jgi:spore coat protein SA
MEAMALGKPLIVSDNGGLPELVDDGKNGFVYSAKTGASALAECIKNMLELSESEYKAMTECSLDKAKRLFNPDKYISEIERLYVEIKK